MAKIKIDFTGVSEGGGYDVSVGKHEAKVQSISQEDGASGYPYLKWMLVITSGKDKGKLISHITTLKPEGLFNLRNTLLACGLDIPKSAVSFDPDKLKGKTLGIEVVITKGKDGADYPNVKKTFRLEEEDAEEPEEDDDELDVF